MKCPRCEAIDLKEMERGGIVIDLCDTCRGVWLDRGELEKFMARARVEELEMERQYSDRRPQEFPVGRRRDHDDDDDDYRRQGTPRRKSWARSLGDLFD